MSVGVPRRAALPLLAVLPWLHPSPAGHPLSLAFLDVQVQDAAILVELRPQATTVLEVRRLELDANGDLELSRAEAEAAWPRIRAYFEEGVALELDGRLQALRFEEFAFEDLPEALGGPDSPWFSRLVARARLPVDRRPARLAVHYELFFEDGNPDHRAHVTVRGLTPQPSRYLLDAAHRSTVVERRSTLALYLRLGWDHVLAGTDHLAFLLGLLLGVAALGSLLAAVTAFTIAHSLTLACSALGLVSLPRHWVEPGIAASVLLVVWMHLRQGTGRAHPWRPAFLFGLLHGFGFAGVLGEIGLPVDARVPALLGFNLGVEAGQLTFILPVAATAALAARWLGAGQRRELRRMAGTVLGAFALGLVADRVMHWWLPGALAAWPEALRGVPVAVVATGCVIPLLRIWPDPLAVPAREPSARTGLAVAEGTRARRVDASPGAAGAQAGRTSTKLGQLPLGALLLYVLYAAGRFLGGLT